MNAGGASLADQAYRSLEHRLVTLQFPPGELLQEQAVAAALGLGRTPVREAVQRLAAAGMLSVLPRKGLQVAPLREAELKNVIETRRVLERLLAVKASQRAGPGDRSRLRALARQLAALPVDAQRFYAVDRQLDDALAGAAGNPFLARSLEPLHMHCRRLWYRHRHSLDLGQSIALHEHLARSVSEGDSAGAIGAVNGIISELETLLVSLNGST